MVADSCFKKVKERAAMHNRTWSFFVFIVLMLVINPHSVQAQNTTTCPENAVYHQRWRENAENRSRMTNSAWNVTGLAVNPSGSMLAIATENNVALYSTETLQLEDALESNTDWSNYGRISLSWSSGGDRLAIARFRSTPSGEPHPQSGIQIWNVEYRQILHTILSEPLAVSWSLSNDLIVFVDVHGIYSLWDENRQLMVHAPSEISEAIGLVDVLEWSPDGTEIAGVNETVSPVVLWDFEDSEQPHILELPIGTGGYIGWSTDSQNLAIGDWTSSSIWIVDTDTQQVIKTLEGSNGNPFDVQWSPDGTLLARGTQNGLFLWDMTTDNPEPIRAFDENVPPFVRIAWLPDSQHLISVDFEGSIYRWDIETGCVEAAVLNDWRPGE